MSTSGRAIVERELKKRRHRTVEEKPRMVEESEKFGNTTPTLRLRTEGSLAKESGFLEIRSRWTTKVGFPGGFGLPIAVRLKNISALSIASDKQIWSIFRPLAGTHNFRLGISAH